MRSTLNVDGRVQSLCTKCIDGSNETIAPSSIVQKLMSTHRRLALTSFDVPSVMEGPLQGGKDEFFCRKPNGNNDGNHTNHLVHRLHLATVMKQLADADSADGTDVNFSRHERSPGKRPTLFHSGDDGR